MFSESTGIPVYSVYEKSDSQEEDHKSYKISFDVSENDWDNFNGQVQDAITFLTKYENDIDMLLKTYDISDAYLDFPIYSRVYGDIVNQNDHLPRQLIVIAGKLSLGIEMAIYSRDTFDTQEHGS